MNRGRVRLFVGSSKPRLNAPGPRRQQGSTEKQPNRGSVRQATRPKAQGSALGLEPIGHSPQRRNILEQWSDELGGGRDGLYRVTKPKKPGLRTYLIRQCHHSAAISVMVEFVEEAWKPWMFSRTPRDWWREASRLFRANDPIARAILFDYLAYLGHKFKVEAVVQWKSPPYSTDIATDSTSIYQLRHFGTIYDLLRAYFPTTEWPDTQVGVNKSNSSPTSEEMASELFEYLGKNWVNDDESRGRFVEKIVAKAGNLAADSAQRKLYALDYSTLMKLGGTPVLNLYSSSVPVMLMTEAPTHAWLPWRFSHTPRNWLRLAGQGLVRDDPVAIAAVRELMERLASELDIRQIEDWPTISLSRTALSRIVHLGDLKLILTRLYPHIEWPFDKTLAGTVDLHNLPAFFASAFNRRQFLQTLVSSAAKHKGTELARQAYSWPWFYRLHYAQFKASGTPLLNLYTQSIVDMVTAEFAEHPWQPWKFRKTPSGWWRRLAGLIKSSHDPIAEAILREYVADLAHSLGVKSLDDWHTTSTRATAKVHLRPFGGLTNVLVQLYPDHKWDYNQLHGVKRPTQHGISRAAGILFPDEDIRQEVTPEDLNFIATGKEKASVHPLRFDVCVPRLRLIFEYQSQRHYKAQGGTFSGVKEADSVLRDLDQQKQLLCEQNNFTLIEVPYWWNGSVSCLAATIISQRPDLKEALAKVDPKAIETEPISAAPPRRQATSTSHAKRRTPIV